MRLSELETLLQKQRERLFGEDAGQRRELLGALFPLPQGQHVLIVSGIRRCGKSTLLRQLAQKLGSSSSIVKLPCCSASRWGSWPCSMC